jgi:hypothetical protein
MVPRSGVARPHVLDRQLAVRALDELEQEIAPDDCRAHPLDPQLIAGALDEIDGHPTKRTSRRVAHDFVERSPSDLRI